MCVCSLPTLHPSFSGLPGPVPPGQRYFVLEDGILHYATTRQDVSQVPGLGCRGEPAPGCSEQVGGVLS